MPDMSHPLRRQWSWHRAPAVRPSDRLVVFSACDSGYLDFASALVRSLDVFSPGFLFVLHLVNPTPEDLVRVEALTDVLGHTRLAVSAESVDLGRFSPEARRSYFASARFLQLPTLLAETALPVLCLDADSLFVNPVDFEFSDRKDADIVLFCSQIDQDVPLKRKIKNGTIVIGTTEGAVALMEEVRDEFLDVFSRDEINWYVDQEVFAGKLIGRRAGLVIGHVRKAYADWEFGGSSIIWAAKGERKDGDERYLILKQMLSDRRPDKLGAPSPESVESSVSAWERALVAIILPRLDLPWKVLDDDAVIPKVKQDTVDLRLQWKRFAIHLANALERKGIRTAMLEMPAQDIQPAVIDRLGYRLVFVPHRCRLDFKHVRTKVLFFMQEYFRWVFVVDRLGWSAASSVYPLDVDTLKPVKSGSFDIYRTMLPGGRLQSKFAQRERMSRLKMVLSGQIPVRRYVFFPLQIPHDQSIRYFSPYPEDEVVRAVLEWSGRSGVPVVFKPHPASEKAMQPYAEMVKAAGAYWSTAHVQDLIERAAAVFTLNSGVGFEALLQRRPVVTFGQSEYDCVSIRATPDSIDGAWTACLATSPADLERRYRRFVDWFLSTYAVDLSQPKFATQRLDAIAATVLEEIAE